MMIPSLRSGSSGLKALSLLLALWVAAPLTSRAQNTPPTVDDWRSRTIYQVLVDRFSSTNGSETGCANLTSYCGGSFAGLTAELSYIQAMGFDAIWISPITSTVGDDYTGYEPSDLTTINPNFGTSADLIEVMTLAQSNNMFVMLDVVANNMGNVCVTPQKCNFTALNPFNTADSFHSCSACPASCSIEDWTNQTQVELCRRAGLPDLNQSNPTVQRQLTSSVKNTVEQYSFDGLRVDSVREVDNDFWGEFVAAGGVFAMGEVQDSDTAYVASYQKPQGSMDGVLSYPLFFTLRDIFASQKSMTALSSMNAAYAQYFGDLGLLGTFIDNHDYPRFLSLNQDQALYQNALAYVLFSRGIPIIYYGTEQSFDGGEIPSNREVLWPTNFDMAGNQFAFMKTAIELRQTLKIWTCDQVEQSVSKSVSKNVYAFSRNSTLVVVTNSGTVATNATVVISTSLYADGTTICDLFKVAPCATVAKGQVSITLVKGLFAVFSPQNHEVTTVERSEDYVEYAK